MLNNDEIEYLRNNKELINQELLDALRTTKQGKGQALDILDLPKDDEEYYLDAFDNRISYQGDRSLKKPYTKINLSEIHIEELKRCFEDIRYFRDNYVRIRTPLDGVNFPDLRPYQNQIIEELQSDDEQYIILSPRQCITGDTIVGEHGETIAEIFSAGEHPMNDNTSMYRTSVLTKVKIKCEKYGWVRPMEILKTIDLDVLKLTFDDGTILKCSAKHSLILSNGEEIYAQDALNHEIKSIKGVTRCTSVEDTGIKEPMYDVVLLLDHHYYTNGILSHNSGKSITIATWLAWLYCFSKDIVIGICANKLSMAAEFLKNTKDILVQLPVWMTPGCKVWNVGSIGGDNGVRILTDSPSDSSFRGFSCNVIVVDECAYLNPLKFEEFKDGILPSQSSLTWKKAIFISTANGLNHFYQMVKGAKARKQIKGIDAKALDDIKKTHKVLDVRRYDDLYDVTLDEPANGHHLIEVDWTEVPRYHENGTPKSPEEFKEEIIAKHGLVHFNQAYANCIDGNCVVCIKQCGDVHNITLSELWGFLKNNRWNALDVEILTNSGWSKFQGLRKTKHNQIYTFVTQKRTIKASLNHRFYYNNKWNFSCDVKVGDVLDGSKVIGVYRSDLKFPNYIELYDVLGTDDHTYIASGTISHNCFIGSSYTILSADAMAKLQAKDPLEVRSNMLNIYEYPIAKHKYILSVDPAKDGIDGFAVNIIDVTSFPFKQVAACSVDVDYFLMPEHIYDWGKMYNTALVIIENNEGAGQSVADMLKMEYEYDNLYKDKARKKYPGFRTTPRSRKLILDTMKMFAENGNLIINDAKTINELYTFILVNGKYQADEGCHDDRVMALALAFAPFCEIKNFTEAKDMIKSFYSQDTDFNFTDHLTIGYFDV